MDDFAQTRGGDDLFESEISPAQTQLPPPSVPTEPRALSSRGGGGQGGGRGGKRGGERGAERGGSGSGSGGGSSGGLQPRSLDQRNLPKEVKAVEDPLEGSTAESKEATEQKKQDRTLSGGLKKIKLTEEELSQRLEQVRLNNQRRLEHHRKAEEDENSFQAQEEAQKQAAETKRVVERKKRVEQDKSRKELDDEREKNRQRKLRAVESREWDSTKTEENYNPRKQSSQFRRGAHGGVDPQRGASQHEFPSSSRGPRGPRGSRGFANGPRGSYNNGSRGSYGGPHRVANASRGSQSRNQATTQEWPGLPPVEKDKTPTEGTEPAAKDEATTKDVLPTNGQPTVTENQPPVEDKPPVKAPEKANLDTGDHIKDTLSPLSPAVGGDSWAEQVESAS